MISRFFSVTIGKSAVTSYKFIAIAKQEPTKKLIDLKCSFIER